MIAANGALSMCPGLTTGAIECLQAWGSEEQKETYLRKLVTGEWTGTMNLTEPQAGSDVGLSTTKADAPGRRHLPGLGHEDLHLASASTTWPRTSSTSSWPASPARPPAPRASRCSSCPSSSSNDDGSLGERNDVQCVSIEHKMGIHASPTCVMSYGDDGGAIGYLVGEENQGMRAMFTMMNSARLAVGVQGVALGDAAYQKALAYAQERRAGPRDRRRLPRARRRSSTTPTSAGCCSS